MSGAEREAAAVDLEWFVRGLSYLARKKLRPNKDLHVNFLQVDGIG
jgi:hypothetical protein